MGTSSVHIFKKNNTFAQGYDDCVIFTSHLFLNSATQESTANIERFGFLIFNCNTKLWFEIHAGLFKQTHIKCQSEEKAKNIYLVPLCVL